MGSNTEKWFQIIMPELPEIETLKNGLRQHLLGERIREVVVRETRMRQPVNLAEFPLKNQKILKMIRRSKYLIIQLTNHQLLCHLGMSGRLRIKKTSTHLTVDKHDHVILRLDHVDLYYNDPRRFGMLQIIDSVDDHPLLKHLGVEPLSNCLTSKYLKSQLQHRQVAIKQALMNNQIVVGIGNIYASESLFHAGILPQRHCTTLVDADYQALVTAIKKTLKAAILAGGTTLKDFFHPDNTPGYFSQQLQVYGREGLLCYHCHNQIIKIKQQNRSTYFCEYCQN